ncbi:MAG: SAM-dependent methyltransferase [Burkholderiales bacterium]|nr:SAM-dependent methyltransferase [Burkholderiales bacterium]
MNDGAPGRLLLVPNTLDHGSDPVPIEAVLARGVLEQAAALRHWVVEDARSARAFLKRVGAVTPLGAPLQEITIAELPRARKGSGEQAPASAWTALLQPALAGHDLGLLSEAGLPAVADPGAQLVAAAHEAGLRVLPLAGPSALMLALAASGLDGQSFAFVGYLPQEALARERRLRELEALSRRQRQTQLFIETPYRNAALAAALLAALQPSTRLAIACGLTLPNGFNRCCRVADWRRTPPAMPDRLPAVFALLAD